MPLTVGKATESVLFDTGGALGLSLPQEMAARAGTVEFLEHKSKFKDINGKVYEVQDFLARDVAIGGVRLAPVKGRVHLLWGGDGAGTQDPLTKARRRGAVGLEAFAGRPLLIDYRRGTVDVFEPGQAPGEAGWTSLSLDYGKLGPQVTLVVHGKKLKFVLDTGSQANVVKPEALGAATISELCGKNEGGANNCSHLDIADARSEDGAPLGPLPLELVPIQGPPFDGLLGTGFFRSHLVFIDTAAGRLLVKRYP